MDYTRLKRIKRIAIVGGGPGGVAAAKGIRNELNTERLDIFEQQASFGGVWNYASEPSRPADIPQTNPNQPLDEPVWYRDESQDGHINGAAHATFPSPMYQRLETNIPHCLMKYSDASSLEDHQLFPSREVVTQYLEEYGESVRDLVHFQTQVTDVRQTHRDSDVVWLVQFRYLQSNDISEREYDAVVVANGHYTVPSLPNINGIQEWNEANKGAISHSKSYRTQELFIDKKVIIVGNSASGVDILSQIATVSKTPILNSTRSDSALTYAANYKENVPEIVEFLPPSQGVRAVRFKNGRVEEHIDAVLFCTGYYYSFPFLTSLSPKLISTGDRVQNLYKHLFYIYDPTLAFVGLPSKIIPFRTFEGQAAVISRVWSHRLKLPHQVEMRKWEETLIRDRGIGKEFHVLPFPRDFEYHNDMVAWASSAGGRGKSRPPPKWSEKETWLRERFPAIKKAFADKGQERHGIRTVEELGFDYGVWLREQRAENII